MVFDPAVPSSGFAGLNSQRLYPPCQSENERRSTGPSCRMLAGIGSSDQCSNRDWTNKSYVFSFPPPRKHTLPPSLEPLGLSLNASRGACRPINEPFRQIALPPQLWSGFRRERHSGWRLFAKRTGTLVKEFHARCGVIVDAPQDISHCASYAHRLRNNSASGTAGVHKLGHHGFQIAKRVFQGDGMGVGFVCLALRLLRHRVSKFSSKLGNPGFLRSDRFRKSGYAVLDLTYFVIGLGGLFLSSLMSKQKRLALPHPRGMSLSGSCMLGAERVQFGLLVPKLALHAINFASLTHLGCTRFVTLQVSQELQVRRRRV